MSGRSLKYDDFYHWSASQSFRQFLQSLLAWQSVRTIKETSAAIKTLIAASNEHQRKNSYSLV